jgi:hypothetical protein
MAPAAPVPVQTIPEIPIGAHREGEAPSEPHCGAGFPPAELQPEKAAPQEPGSHGGSPSHSVGTVVK